MRVHGASRDHEQLKHLDRTACSRALFRKLFSPVVSYALASGPPSSSGVDASAYDTTGERSFLDKALEHAALSRCLSCS